MLSVNLRVIMAKNKIDSVKELMRMSGLSRNAINRLYHEDDVGGVRFDTLTTLCDTLECNLSDLIEYEPNRIKK